MSEVDDMLEDFGAATLDEYFGVSVVLVRGGVESTAFTATWCDKDEEVFDSEGFATRVRWRDFEFVKTAVVISTATITPRAGDRIKITENSAVKTFEVGAIGKRPACEEMVGGFRWLVHAKQVG